jgi:Ca2+-binding EF-hand superfamily protein
MKSLSQHRPSKRTLIALTLAAMLVVPVAHAQPQQPPTPPGPMTFSAFDLDGDGVVTVIEFDTARAQRMAQRAASGAPMRGAANAPTFGDFDLNGDGRLTADEFAAVHPRMQGRSGGGMAPGMGEGPGPGMGPGAGRGMGSGMGRDMPSFADFDLDGDGALTEQELAEGRAKRIAERSQQGYPMRNLANAPSFDALDRDGDGRITPDEFAVGQASHMRQGMPAP